MKKIVITGGPCSGKTTIINELKKKGFPILAETAKSIVEARRHIPMTKEEEEIRQELITTEQLRKEKDAEKESYDILFLDRCAIDGVAYALLYSGEDCANKYISLIEKKNYNFIFILDLLEFKSEGFRAGNENEKEAKKIHDTLVKIHEEFGNKIIRVPVLPVEKRVEFILENIKSQKFSPSEQH